MAVVVEGRDFESSSYTNVLMQNAPVKTGGGADTAPLAACESLGCCFCAIDGG